MDRGDESRIIRRVILALAIFLLAQVLYKALAVNIAGIEFYVASDAGEKTEFEVGEKVYLKACPTLGAPATVQIEVYLYYPAESGRSPAQILPRQVFQNIRCGDTIVRYIIPSGDPEGSYSFRVRVYDQAGNFISEGYVPFAVKSPTPWWLTPEFIVAVVAILVAAVLGGFILLRRAPSPAPVAAPPQAAVETRVLAPGTIEIRAGGETLTYTGGLQLGDRLIPLKGIPQEFGREDFRGLIPDEQLAFISRRHFRISYDYSRGCFTVEDLGSKNGTFVDGEDIRGRGPVPIKDGSIISPAGIVSLRFTIRSVT